MSNLTVQKSSKEAAVTGQKCASPTRDQLVQRIQDHELHLAAESNTIHAVVGKQPCVYRVEYAVYKPFS